MQNQDEPRSGSASEPSVTPLDLDTGDAQQALMIEAGDIETGDIEESAFERTLDETRVSGPDCQQGLMIEAGDYIDDHLAPPDWEGDE